MRIVSLIALYHLSVSGSCWWSSGLGWGGSQALWYSSEFK